VKKTLSRKAVFHAIEQDIGQAQEGNQEKVCKTEETLP
jgi:hypothetical protein